MTLFDKLKTEKNEKLSEEEVIQAFRQACWDLYVANLPDPVIIDSDDSKNLRNEKIPDELKDAVPRGFCIDPKTWTIYFNMQDLPQYLNDKEELIQYSRSIFQHEETHFTQLPADGLTEAILVDSALKALSHQASQNKEQAAGYAYVTMNIMGDLIGDTLLAKENYGREDFENLTVWRTKQVVKEARQTKQNPSLLWQTIVSTYEKLWKEDLGLDDYIQRRDSKAEKAAEELVSILGNDWKDRKTWEEKIKRFTKTLEPIIRQSAQEARNQKGQSRYGKGKGKGGSGLEMPDDVTTQLGNPTESPLEGKESKGKEGKGKGKGTKLDERVLGEVYQRNKNSPGKFAGTMGALKKVEPDDALRLMYRARAKELLMSIKEKENQRAEKSPAYQTAWNIGDPIVGKEGLELVPSMMASGKPVPGLTTYKRKMETSEGFGKLKMIPDLFIVIDSSGSMDWHPWEDHPNSRGDFDKAILAAEGAALYAIENGGRIAVINFSGQGNITRQEYTRDIDKIEKAIMVNYHGGTVVPIKKVYDMIKKTSNPLLTCLMSDCEIQNWENACDDAFAHGITEHDNVAVFNINRGTGSSFTNRIEERGAIIYNVDKIEDLIGVIIGQVKREYDSRLGGKDVHNR